MKKLYLISENLMRRSLNKILESISVKGAICWQAIFIDTKRLFFFQTASPNNNSQNTVGAAVNKKLWMAFLQIMVVSAGALVANAQTTFSFTTAGASGRFGPTQAQLNSAYLNTNLAGAVVSNEGIQEWVVPATGTYRIVSRGASGGEVQGSYFPGRAGTGATIQGDFFLTAGTVLKVVVGQKGIYANNGSSGGGGSFVFTGLPSGNGLLMVAGGGGGHGHGSSSFPNGASGGGGSATATTVGGTGNGSAASGGAGQGGLGGGAPCGNGAGSGGAGWLSNGGNSTCDLNSIGGNATTFIGGSSVQPSVGGFGGGGGTWGNGSGGGGGGGYSGGGGGNGWTGLIWGAGAGAGSFNSGGSPINTAGVTAAASGHLDGAVNLTLLSPTVSTGTVNTPICAGSTIAVPFATSANFNAGNVFTAQLSDASGSFAAPVSIGSVSAISTGTISAIIPSNTISGTAYRIRVAASLPLTVSTDNGVNLTVNPLLVFYADADNDGFGDALSPTSACEAPSGYVTDNTDCDDTNNTIHQTYLFYVDADNDGVGTGSLVSVCALNGATPQTGYALTNTDCDSTNGTIYQSASLFIDGDGDGFDNGSSIQCYGSLVPVGYSLTTNGSDCDDANALKYDTFSFYADTDGDTYGTGALISGICAENASTPPAGYATNNTDCNDNNALQFQTFPFYVDADGDTYGTGAVVNLCAVNATTPPTGHSVNNTDCNDSNAAVHATFSFYADTDGDTYGTGALIPGICAENASTPPAGYATNNTDCNDNNALQFQTFPFYADADGDSYGAGAVVNLCAVNATTPPTGYAVNNTDCNDANAAIHMTFTFYIDADGDGFGFGTAQQLCALNATSPPAGYVTNNLDCNDAQVRYQDLDGDLFGSTIKVPCGGRPTSTDCNDNLLTYRDLDGDGYGVNVLVPCGVPNRTDCNDNSASVYQSNLLFVDADGDGYTNGQSFTVCYGATIPPGFAAANIGIDCDDNFAAINPGATEVAYNGIDDDCDGSTDEGFPLITTSLLTGDCNSTLASIGSLIGISTLPSGSLITGYRIRATNGAQVQVIERGVPHFTMQMFTSYTYATTYTIEIELQRNGVWLGYYGAACQISTPAILAEGGASAVSASQCGITLPKINTLIATTSIAGVTGYRFRVTNLTDPVGPNPVQFVTRPLNWFTLQMLTRYNYGTTYRIEVAVKTTGDFGGYGSPCEVSSPPAPSLVNCSAVVAAPTTPVACTNLAGVTQYRFQVTRDSDSASTTIDRSNSFFTFNMIPAAVFTPGGLYNVRVAVMTLGTWSPFGDICQITAPASLAKPAAEGVSEPKVDFRAVASPNPFTADFGIDITTTSADNIAVRVYDMLGRLVESSELQVSDLDTAQMGAQYPAGVYNVIVSQSGIVKTLRVIKR